MDVSNTKSKLEKGLKTLHILDNDINSFSHWLNEVEEKLYEIENNYSPETHLNSQLQYIKVSISTTFIMFYFNNIFLYILYSIL